MSHFALVHLYVTKAVIFKINYFCHKKFKKVKIIIINHFIDCIVKKTIKSCIYF